MSEIEQLRVIMESASDVGLRAYYIWLAQKVLFDAAWTVIIALLLRSILSAFKRELYD